MNKNLVGMFPAMLTPFDEQGRILDEPLQRHVDDLIKRGIKGFYVNGSTAESFLMTAEERKLLQTLIDDSYEQFVAAVADGRKMPVEEVKTLADGRIYTGRQALDSKLVDKLGDLQDALDLAGEMSKIGKNPRIFREVNPIDQFFSIIDSKLSFFSGASVEKALNASPRLEYRWYGL